MEFKFDLQRFDGEGVYLQDELKGFVPKPIATQIIADVTRGSSVLRLANVQQMTSDNQTFPVMASTPSAYWVGEAQRIQTTKATWIFPEMVAKKIAAIIPVTREKVNDTTINVFNEIRPHLTEAFHRTIDAACLFGEGSPFATNIFGAATGASMSVQVGTNARLDLDVSDMMALIEAKGFDVNGFISDISFKNSLRKLRDANGNQLYVQGITDKFGQTYDTLYSLPVEFNRTTAWDKTKALCIGGNWRYAIVGIREEINYEVLREATLQNVMMEDEKPLSLAENDMIAIKATMRLGFLVIKPDAFAVLTPKSTAPDEGDDGSEAGNDSEGGVTP